MELTKKKSFILGVLGINTDLCRMDENVSRAVEVYEDRNYGATLTNEDLAEHEMTKAEFMTIAGMLINFTKFLNNGEPAKNDYKAIANNFRNDI